MSEAKWRSEREQAIHLLRSGLNLTQVSQQMKRSIGWVHKWKKRYETEGWQGLQSRSRQPRSIPHAYSSDMRQLVCQIRSELEVGASRDGLCFIGAPTIRAYLLKRCRRAQSIPSISTIERILKQAGFTQAKSDNKPETNYPGLLVTAAHQVQQLDIVPHHLAGGQSVTCFNAIDVFSRYPTGQTRVRKTSQDASQFLLNIWRDSGIASYTQMDNEGRFTGGNTHPYVIGKVVRLCLMVGTQALFIPIRHPKTNAIIERFHQTYDRHVWHRYYLDDPRLVNQHATDFFDEYRQQHYHSALNYRTPQQLHEIVSPRLLPDTFSPALQHLPITEGCIHFIRKVEAHAHVPILNHRWFASHQLVDTGIRATLQFRAGRDHADLSIYDQSPDILSRRCLAHHIFPLPQSVIPLQPDFISRSPDKARPIHQIMMQFIRKTFTML